MSLNMKALVVGALGVNCYILHEEGSKEAIAIDPGGSEESGAANPHPHVHPPPRSALRYFPSSLHNQTFLHARRRKSRIGKSIPAERLAYAERRKRRPMAYGNRFAEIIC